MILEFCYQINSYHSIVKAQGSRSYSPSRAIQSIPPSREESSHAMDDDVTQEVPPPTDPIDATETDEVMRKRSSYIR